MFQRILTPFRDQKYKILEERGTAPSHSGIEKGEGPLPTSHSARASIRLLSAHDPSSPPLPLAVFEQFEH